MVIIEHSPQDSSFNNTQVISAALEAIDKHGWVSTSDAKKIDACSTAVASLEYLATPIKKEADTIINWFSDNYGQSGGHYARCQASLEDNNLNTSMAAWIIYIYSKRSNHKSSYIRDIFSPVRDILALEFKDKIKAINEKISELESSKGVLTRQCNHIFTKNNKHCEICQVESSELFLSTAGTKSNLLEMFKSRSTLNFGRGMNTPNEILDSAIEFINTLEDFLPLSTCFDYGLVRPRLKPSLTNNSVVIDIAEEGFYGSLTITNDGLTLEYLDWEDSRITLNNVGVIDILDELSNVLMDAPK